MRDVTGERVNHYLYQFYSSKDSYTLLSELKKLIYKKDDEFKLDILDIERLLKERDLEQDIDLVYKYVAENKIINKIDFKRLIKSYKAVFLKENRLFVTFSFGSFVLLSSILYFTPETWNIFNGIITLCAFIPAVFTAWIILEPVLTCLALPLIRLILDTIGLIIQGLGELFNQMTGSLKKQSFFYDKERNKPLIEKNAHLSPYDIMVIEGIFEKKELTEEQAKIYLNSLLSIKRNISSNLS